MLEETKIATSKFCHNLSTKAFVRILNLSAGPARKAVLGGKVAERGWAGNTLKKDLGPIRCDGMTIKTMKGKQQQQKTIPC